MEIVTITTEYITLGQFLKFVSIISNGSEARSYLEENTCLVNDEEENRRGRKLYPGYRVRVEDREFLIEE